MIEDSRKVRGFLVGEGANELGSYAGHRTYWSDKKPGVIQALLRRVQPTGWEVGGARTWKSIRKLRARSASHADTHNVLGAALDAKEADCEMLAFVRDTDKDAEREAAIDSGIDQIPVRNLRRSETVGGPAIPTLEAWILALLGERATEALTPKRAEANFIAKGLRAKDGEAMVRIAEDADFSQIPGDASSLTKWLSRARAALPKLVAAKSSRA